MIKRTEYRVLLVASCVVTLLGACNKPESHLQSNADRPAPNRSNIDRSAESSTIPSHADQQDRPSEGPANSGEGWPVFRGNAQSTGVASCGLADRPEILWEFKVPGGAFEGSPVIVATDDNPKRHTVFIGDLDGRLFSLDLATGKKNWEFKTDIGFVAAPAVMDGRIYIGDMDGVFYCVDETGNKIWSFQSESEIDSSANFHENKVLVGSQDSHLYALDQKTGGLVWKYASPDQIRCSVTIAGNRAFVAGCDGYFHIIDLADGSEAGKTDIHSPTGATPAVLGDRVFFGNEGGDFFAIDWKRAEQKWAHSDPQSGNSIRSSAAVTPHQVIFGGRNRIVHSLNPETGDKIWSVTLKAKIDASPVIVGDRVFVASTDGRLAALSVVDGAPAWEKQFNGGFASSPAVAFDHLVIATDRGVVYCLGERPTKTESTKTE